MASLGHKNTFSKPMSKEENTPVEPTSIGQKVVFTTPERKLISDAGFQRYSTAEDRKIEAFNQKWGSQPSLNQSSHDPKGLELDQRSKTGEAIAEKELQQAQNIHEMKRLRAWGLVLEVLNEWKIQEIADSQATGNWAVADRIPRAGRYVTFPLHNTEKNTDHFNGVPITITWKQSNTQFETVYYKTTCWFGKIKAPSDNPPVQSEAQSAFLPFGETDLFIASEFIEARYQGAPHLKAFHLRDRSHGQSDHPWMTLLIDSSFHYGQDSSNPTYRYMVYHPFIRPRMIPQRSFVSNTLLDMAKDGTGDARINPRKATPAADPISRAVVSRIEQWSEDYLRQFECIEARKETPSYGKEVQQLNQKLQSKETGFNMTQEVQGMVRDIKEADIRNKAAETVFEMVKEEEAAAEELTANSTQTMNHIMDEDGSCLGKRRGSRLQGNSNKKGSPFTAAAFGPVSQRAFSCAKAPDLKHNIDPLVSSKSIKKIETPASKMKKASEEVVIKLRNNPTTMEQDGEDHRTEPSRGWLIPVKSK